MSLSEKIQSFTMKYGVKYGSVDMVCHVEIAHVHILLT